MISGFFCFKNPERKRRTLDRASSANVFFASGMIAAWGRRFEKIKEACAKHDGPLPEYNISASGIMVLCKACDKYLKLLYGESHPAQSEQGVKFCFAIDFHPLYSFWDEYKGILKVIGQITPRE